MTARTRLAVLWAELEARGATVHRTPTATAWQRRAAITAATIRLRALDEGQRVGWQPPDVRTALARLEAA